MSLTRATVTVTLAAAAMLASVSGQAPGVPPAVAKVDFVRDVQPILREHCFSCHGPAQQMNGFRLDRRSDALRGGTFPVIAPGNSDGSRFYQRLIGTQFGAQMPPTGRLAPEQIATLKAWIDQGVAWPDAVSGELPPPVADPGATRLIAAIRGGDRDAFARLLGANRQSVNRTDATGSTPLMYAAFYGDRAQVQALLDSRANPNYVNPSGATALMWAVTDLGKTQALLAAGANPNARSDDGRTPILIAAGLLDGGPVVERLLDYGANTEAMRTNDVAPLREAARIGDATMFQTLLTYGADPRGPGAPTPAFVRNNCPTCADLLGPGAAAPLAPPAAAAAPQPPPPTTFVYSGPAPDTRRPVEVSPASIHAAVERSLPLIQKSDVAFMQKIGCVSCHQNSVAALAVSTARANGYKVDEALASRQMKATAAYIDSWRDRSFQGLGILGAQDSVSYIVYGLAVEHYPGDSATDAQAFFLKTRQLANGQWRIAARRPPIESNDIQVTALSMRILQVYGPKTHQAEYTRAVENARDWLTTAKGDSLEEKAFRLLGLSWAGASPAVVQSAAQDLLADQRPDGGWAQTPALAPDAYATGQALVALASSGSLQPSDARYLRGAQWLLNDQYADGSWHVATRANPIQAPFESGFPHGKDQWISAAGTSWAAAALALYK